MHRRLVMLIAAIVVAGGLSGVPANVSPVQAAGPTEGPTFNDPTGTETQQMAIMDKIVKAIDGVPRGGTIRMAMFSFTIQKFADRLIAAHKRGVKVRMILDDHETFPAWERMEKQLGRNPRAASFAVKCRGACLTENEPSYMHTKIYMFSESSGVPLVVMVSSANPTYFQARRGWNNGYTIVGDAIMYDAFKRNFETMAAASANPNQPTTSPDAYFTATSGKHKVYFFPKGGVGAANDPMFGILNNIRCTGLASGYGSGGRTTIRIAMYQWSILRVRLANRIWTLDDQGCKVTIMFDPTRVDPGVLRALTKPGGRHGGPTIVPAATDEDDNGVVDQMVHDKYMLVDGSYAGDTSARVVFTGSANWTNNALHYNDEFMLRIWDNAVFTSFRKHWDKVREFAKASIGTATALRPATGRVRSRPVRSSFEVLIPGGDERGWD